MLPVLPVVWMCVALHKGCCLRMQVCAPGVRPLQQPERGIARGGGGRADRDRGQAHGAGRQAGAGAAAGHRPRLRALARRPARCDYTPFLTVDGTVKLAPLEAQ